MSVTLNADVLVEPDETFLVNLGHPTNAVLADARGVGTITLPPEVPQTPTVVPTASPTPDGRGGYRGVRRFVALTDPPWS